MQLPPICLQVLELGIREQEVAKGSQGMEKVGTGGAVAEVR